MRGLFLILFIGAGLLASCGGSETANPNPAPAPGNPNPAPTPTPTPVPSPVGSPCDLYAPQTARLSATPYQSNLRSVYPHPNAAGTLSMWLAFAQDYPFDAVIKGVVGAGTMEINDRIVSRFCVKSDFGQVHSQQMSVWMALTGGFIGTPLPGNSPPLGVRIGGSPQCTAYLYQGRIVGCIDIELTQSILTGRYRFIAQ